MKNNISKDFDLKHRLSKQSSQLRGKGNETQHFAHGGKVVGKGGPTDDKVGPVMLSDGEYVLPADTVDAVGVQKLNRLTAETHEPVSESKRGGLRGMANGGFIPDYIVGGNGTAVPINAAPEVQRAQAAAMARSNAAGLAAQEAQAGARARVASLGAPATLPEVTAATRAAAPAVAPVAETGALARTGSALRTGLGLAGRAATIAPALAGGFDWSGNGDRMVADTNGVDTSLGGTVSALRNGEFSKAGTSLSGGLAEAVGDVGTSLARTGDWAAGLVGAKPELSRGFDNLAKDVTGGYLQRNPAFTAPDPRTPAATVASGGTVNPPNPLQQGGRVDLNGPPSSIAAPAVNDSAQARFLSENGVNPSAITGPAAATGNPAMGRGILRNQGTNQPQNLGTYGGNAPIFGQADRPGGRINDFTGAGADTPAVPGRDLSATSQLANLRALNGGVLASDQPLNQGVASTGTRAGANRLDELGGNTVNGVGFAARHAAQNRQLDNQERATNNSDLASQRSYAASLRSTEQSDINNSRQADASRYSSDVTRANSVDATTSAAADRAAARRAAAITAAAAADETGFKRLGDGIDSAFTTMVDGKAVVDKTAANQFQQYLLGSDTKTADGRTFTSLPPQEQQKNLTTMLKQFQLGQAANDASQRQIFKQGAGVTNQVNQPVSLRNSDFMDDVIHGSMAVPDWLQSKRGGVIQYQNGNVAPYRATVGDDADKKKLLRGLRDDR